MNIKQQRIQAGKPYSLTHYYKLHKSLGMQEEIKNKRKQGLTTLVSELKLRDRIRNKEQLLKFIGFTMEFEAYTSCVYTLMDLIRCEVVELYGRGYRLKNNISDTV